MRDYVIVLMENLCWIPHKLAMFVLVSKALFTSKKTSTRSQVHEQVIMA